MLRKLQTTGLHMLEFVSPTFSSQRSAVGETGLALGALNTVWLDMGTLDTGSTEVLLGLSCSGCSQ